MIVAAAAAAALVMVSAVMSGGARGGWDVSEASKREGPSAAISGEANAEKAHRG